MNNGSSSDEARKAVLDAIKKLNYQPSCFAKNIRTQKSMTIALMIPDASNFFYTEMFKAVEQVAYEHEYMVILCDTQNSTDAEIEYAEKLQQRRIDGLIYCTYRMDKEAQNYFLSLSRKLPVVFTDNSFHRGLQQLAECRPFPVSQGLPPYRLYQFPQGRSCHISPLRGLFEGAGRLRARPQP